MKYDIQVIETKLAEALEDWDDDNNLSIDQKRDIIFHMVDWLDDLKQWSNFCQDPSQYSSDDVQSLLTYILCHIPEHIAAAAKLLINQPIRDIFEVGVTTEDEERT